MIKEREGLSTVGHAVVKRITPKGQVCTQKMTPQETKFTVNERPRKRDPAKYRQFHLLYNPIDLATVQRRSTPKT